MSDVLYGGMIAYYSFRGRDPYLSFDGYNDRVSIPTVTLSGDFDISISASYKSLKSDYAIILGETAGTGTWIAFKSDGVEVRINNNQILSVYPTVANTKYSLRVSRVGSAVTVYVDGVSIGSFSSSSQLVFDSMSQGVSGSFFCATDIYSVVGLGNYSYIQHGDQSPSAVLPSHPSGADGTLVGGAGWKYVGIDGHYSTNALLLNYINSTTLTEPLNIILLEPMDLTGIPTSKDGQPVTIDMSFLPKTDNAYSYDFNYDYA